MPRHEDHYGPVSNKPYLLSWGGTLVAGVSTFLSGFGLVLEMRLQDMVTINKGY
jgi:hypothetical protein